MISFAFTDEQEDYRRQLRRFAETELAPKYRERAAKDEFPWDAHRQLGELGVLSIGLPEEYGGAGATDDDPITLGIATEALAYGDVNVGAAPVQVGLVASQLAHDGQPSVAREWVPKLITGEVVAAIAVTEPSGGSDAVNLRTTARKVDGGWLLNGEKIGITHATTGQIGLVYAREPGSQGSKGVSCFLVPLDSAGVTRSRVLAMGCLPLGWGGLSFEDVFVPEDHLIGEEGRGFAGGMGPFDFSRPALGLRRPAWTKPSAGPRSARRSVVRSRPSRASASRSQSTRRTWKRRAGSATARCGRGPSAEPTRSTPR